MAWLKGINRSQLMFNFQQFFPQKNCYHDKEILSITILIFWFILLTKLWLQSKDIATWKNFEWFVTLPCTTIVNSFNLDNLFYWPSALRDQITIMHYFFVCDNVINKVLLLFSTENHFSLSYQRILLSLTGVKKV